MWIARQRRRWRVEARIARGRAARSEATGQVKNRGGKIERALKCGLGTLRVAPGHGRSHFNDTSSLPSQQLDLDENVQCSLLRIPKTLRSLSDVLPRTYCTFDPDILQRRLAEATSSWVQLWFLIAMSAQKHPMYLLDLLASTQTENWKSTSYSKIIPSDQFIQNVDNFRDWQKDDGYDFSNLTCGVPRYFIRSLYNVYEQSR
jgi:hypothetical protein